MTAPAVRNKYVSYLYSGIVNEVDRAHPVRVRDVYETAKAAPKDATGFLFYDILTITVESDGVQVELKSEMLNASTHYYIDAEILDRDAVRQMNKPILLANMGATNKLLRNRRGLYQMVWDSDYELVSTH